MAYYDEDGNILNPNLVPTPSLCIACAQYYLDDEQEEIFCNLTRLNQRDQDYFDCQAFVSVNGSSKRRNM